MISFLFKNIHMAVCIKVSATAQKKALDGYSNIICDTQKIMY